MERFIEHVTADDTETQREAARFLVAPLAAEYLAESLGVARSPDECLAAARERGLDMLVTCRVIEYDPYDPARIFDIDSNHVAAR